METQLVPPSKALALVLSAIPTRLKMQPWAVLVIMP